MKRLSGIAMLRCAFASAMLMHAAFLSQNAIAGSSGAAWSTTVQPSGVGAYDLAEDAEDKGAAGKTDTANAKPDGHSGLVNDETLYPTAAQCGECHKQIYEEWSSSNHAYASISPMFH